MAKEKKIKNGFVARMISSILGAAEGVFCAFLMITNGTDGFYTTIFCILTVLYAGLIVLAVLGKKKALYNTLFLVGTLLTVVVLVATGAWGYYGVVVVILIAIFGIVGALRGNKVLKAK